MNNDPISNMPVYLFCINDNSSNNSNIAIIQRLRYGLSENFYPFILFFWLVLLPYDYLISIVGKYLLLQNHNG